MLCRFFSDDHRPVSGRSKVPLIEHFVVIGQHHYLIPVSFLAFVADGLLGRTTGRNQPLGFADEGHVAVISHKDLLTCTAFRLRKKTNRKYRTFRFEGCELYVGYFPVSAQHIVFAAFFRSGGRQDRFAGGLLPSLESIGAMSMVWLVVRPMTLERWPNAAAGHGAPQKPVSSFLTNIWIRSWLKTENVHAVRGETGRLQDLSATRLLN